MPPQLGSLDPPVLLVLVLVVVVLVVLSMSDYCTVYVCSAVLCSYRQTDRQTGGL